MDITNIFLTLSLIGGKWIFYLLLLLSVISITIIIERLLFFWGNRAKQVDFDSEIQFLLKEHGQEGARQFVQIQNGPEARCLQQAIPYWEDGMEAVEQAFAQQICQEKLAMDKRLLFLGTLGNNAPFIGLLGTVLGIIKAFHDLSVTGSGGPQVVMMGIAEALIATALGLFVAIPAVIAYNFFQRQTQNICQRLETFAQKNIRLMKKLKEETDGARLA